MKSEYLFACLTALLSVGVNAIHSQKRDSPAGLPFIEKKTAEQDNTVEKVRYLDEVQMSLSVAPNPYTTKPIPGSHDNPFQPPPMRRSPDESVLPNPYTTKPIPGAIGNPFSPPADATMPAMSPTPNAYQPGIFSATPTLPDSYSAPSDTTEPPSAAATMPPSSSMNYTTPVGYSATSSSSSAVTSAGTLQASSPAKASSGAVAERRAPWGVGAAVAGVGMLVFV